MLNALLILHLGFIHEGYWGEVEQVCVRFSVSCGSSGGMGSIESCLVN